MTRAIRVLVLLAVLGGVAAAQSVPAIEQVRLGLPSGQGGDQTGRSRRAAWAPVYVQLKGGATSVAQNQLQLAVVARDTEQTLSRYLVPVPAIASGEVKTVLAYVRPESLSQFEVQLLDPAGSVKAQKNESLSDLNREVLGGGAIFYVTLGSRLELARALRPDADKKKKDAEEFDPDEEDRGQRRYAYLDTFKDLPDRWFGYDAADVVVLPTGNERFVRDLVEGDAARRDALAEWVARGGRLVISVAQNHQLVQRFLEQNRLIDVTIKGSRIRDTLPQVFAWVGGEAAPAKFEIADLDVGPSASVLVREEPQGADRAERPIVVQASYGLGRVLLVGFDLDGGKFREWSGHRAFWQKVDGYVGPKVFAGRAEMVGPAGQPMGADPNMRNPAELLGTLRGQLETFAEVPVISFGWVALFILFYILLVGPIDYFLLKRVFKRLELTWITFPAIVIVVSLLAYLGAYYSKGDDLRVNKVDLVQIDLHPAGSPQVYGTTWFSLFSPRISNYTLGVEPSPAWAEPAVGVDPRSGTVLSLLAAPEQASRIGSQGLFPQPYDYAPDASGLKGMPIPVWSSRAFVANWRAPAKKAAPPIAADLAVSRLPDGLIQGPLTNNLDVPLEGLVAFYQGRMYPVGTLQPGETRRTEDEVQRAKGQERGIWKDSNVFRGPGVNGFVVKNLLFPELTGEGTNSGLRAYDQGWRLSQQPEYRSRGTPNWRHEVILVGRLAPSAGRGNAADAPARLWLGALPEAGKEPPELEASVRQETYVRVFIPVRPAQ